MGRFLLYSMLTLPCVALCENDELWDDYPSLVAFEQFAAALSLGATTRSWYAFGGLSGLPKDPTIDVTIVDSASSATFALPGFGTLVQQPDAFWQWDPVHADTLDSGSCRFDYALELGSLELPFAEGYQLAQRESLAWSGPDDSCPDRVRWYLDRARLEPVMPLHVSDWQNLAAPAPPADNGRIEVVLVHDVRRTRLLLPLDEPAELDADPWNGALRTPGDGTSRFARIAARLAPLVFASGFEGP
jgi:hypothetical protein